MLTLNRDGSGVAGNPGGALDPRIWSYGHRNVQGIAFRPSDGAGFSVEHGPDRDDELNALVTGQLRLEPRPDERLRVQRGVPMTDLQEFPDAVRAFWYSGTPTVAPSGMTFLSGSQWKSWNGVLAIALLKGSKLYAFKLDQGGQLVDVGVAISDHGRLRSPVQGPDGNLYITTDNGGNTDVILKVTPK